MRDCPHRGGTRIVIRLGRKTKAGALPVTAAKRMLRTPAQRQIAMREGGMRKGGAKRRRV